MGDGMSEHWDVVIAGGAVMGASAAYWLTRMQPGLRVMVVEMDPSYSRSSLRRRAIALNASSTTRLPM